MSVEQGPEAKIEKFGVASAVGSIVAIASMEVTDVVASPATATAFGLFFGLAAGLAVFKNHQPRPEGRV